MAAILQVQKTQPLHWVIDSAPLVLSVFASFAGKRQDVVEAITKHTLSVNARLEEEIKDRIEAQEAMSAARQKAEALQWKAEAAQQIAEQAEQAQGAFLAAMSHEIRTPMNAVIGLTSLLVDMPLDQQQKTLVQRIKTSGTALLHVIDNILDFSKVRAAQLHLEQRSFELEKTVSASISIVAAQYLNKPLSFSYEIDETVPKAVTGDSNRLQQILVNLLNNAAKFTEAGSVGLRITNLGLIGDDAEARRFELGFAVQDTGIGISEEGVSRLFTPYSQAEISTTRRYGGTGLGLAISQHLTELMGGRIWVKSKIDEGSTFHFTVQLQESNVVDDAIDNKDNDYSELGQRCIVKILLVEDNEINRDVATVILAHLGYDADVAKDGFEALKALQREHYDVVLMDLQMPDMDGLEATRRIRTELSLDRQPYIIALTANAFIEDRLACLEAGMDDYISKPFELEDLTAALLRSRAPAAAHESSVASLASGNAAISTMPEDEERTSSFLPPGDTAGEMVDTADMAPEPGFSGDDSGSVGPVDEGVLERLCTNLGERNQAKLPWLIDKYCEAGEQMLADMRQALDQDNFAELSRLAHMFNANSASFGAVKLAEMARHIELMVSEDTVSGFDAILEHMTLHYHELRPILKQKGAELASSAQSIA